MASERPLGRLAILGLGLMGGSLARAVSALQVADRVTGWSPNSTERDAALTAGAVQFVAVDWRDAAADADVVVLAMPLSAALDLLGAIAQVTSDETTITDVVSLKHPLQIAAEAAGVAPRWVGAHPMAGGERSGFWASRTDLYHGVRVWTVPGAETDHADRVDRLWGAVGAETRPIGAEEHDRLMALASHLPQLVSNVLAAVLAGSEVGAEQLGPGGRDMTRLSGSDPVMWLDLLDHAAPELVTGLRAVAAETERVATRVESGDLAALERLMRDTRSWRART